MLLKYSYYIVDLLSCLTVENCKKRNLASLREVYDRHAGDVKIAKTFAKALLLFHGSVHLSLMLDGVLEDVDAQQDLNEATKIV
jgi:hypothetical protein